LANASDFDPQQAFKTRQKIVEAYADTSAIVLTGHFPKQTAGRIVSKGDGFLFKWLNASG
jgi:hypothetical protein